MAVEEWARKDGRACALGFIPAKTPCGASFSTSVHVLLEATLGARAESVCGATTTRNEAGKGIASDGKTPRGHRKQGAPGANLLSLLLHPMGLTLAQQAVDTKTNRAPTSTMSFRACC